jgi:uncharacterized protein YggU (UPF0235/DUF167 family)
MAGVCTVSVRLKPNSKQQKIELFADDTLQAWVTAPPVEGKANAALIELLSDTLDLPKSRLSIKHGLASKNKVVAVVGLTKEEMLRLLRARSGRAG